MCTCLSRHTCVCARALADTRVCVHVLTRHTCVYEASESRPSSPSRKMVEYIMTLPTMITLLRFGLDSLMYLGRHSTHVAQRNYHGPFLSDSSDSRGWEYQRPNVWTLRKYWGCLGATKKPVLQQQLRFEKKKDSAASRVRTCAGSPHWISSPTP